MFGKRINILNLVGIKIGIDISWFFIAILMTWTLAAGYFPFRYPQLPQETYWIMSVIGMLGLFVCIVLHELGHALVAKYYELPISQITLFIFGGVAEIRKEPEKPKVELLMAIAGPLVSIALAAGLYALTLLGERLGWPTPVLAVTNYLATLNAIIAAFNLIPAFPLDGGRVFRALLWWWKKDYEWATHISSRFGIGFGFVLIFLGIFALISGNLLAGMWYVILGWFLTRAAASSRSRLFVGKELKNEKVQKFMTKRPISVQPGITLKDFVEEYVYTSHHHLYPVAENGQLVGYISLNEVKAFPHEKWEKTTVKRAMVSRKKFQTVTPQTNAMEALDLLQSMDSTTLIVVDGQKLVGILTAQNLFKLISLKLELEESAQGG